MIYENITFKEYLELPGLNASKLKPYSISPAKGKYEETKTFKRTMAMSLGSIVHAYVLEGDEAARQLIEQHYITSGFPINEKTEKPFGEGTAKYKSWLATQDETKEVIFPDVLRNTVLNITDAINGHTESRDILKRADKRETAITWTCQYTGVECKALVDFFGNDLIGDLKTFGKEMTHHSLEREMYDRKYHIQFSYYLDGLNQNGYEVEDFYVIFARTCEDYDVGAFLIDPSTIAQGRKDYIRAIRNYQKATNNPAHITGSFPYLGRLGIPRYHINNDEEIDSEEQEIIQGLLSEK